MDLKTGVSFSELTTLRVGGPIAELVTATSVDEVVEAFQTASGAAMALGGGSNLLVGDEGFDGRVVQIANRGVAISGDLVTVQAGEPWVDLVDQTISEGLSGFETLAGIPGLTGATPVQNVGAYGTEIASTFVSLKAYDRTEDAVRTFSNQDCQFAYRTSRFKRNERFVILEVTFRLERSALSQPVRYAELAKALSLEIGERAPLVDVAQAVLALRRKKGMVLDAHDFDTRSAGSFFTNPIVPVEVAEGIPDIPTWPAGDGRVKVSAAWLIERAGFSKGYARGAVRLSTKHTLAITNWDGGTASDVVALAHEVQAGVLDQFGIELHVEPVTVGVGV